MYAEHGHWLHHAARPDPQCMINAENKQQFDAEFQGRKLALDFNKNERREE